MIVNELKDSPANAVLQRKRDDGKWDIYLPGDQLPLDFLEERELQNNQN